MLKKTLQKLTKPKEVQVRRTGRSTAEALDILSRAISNPNEWIEIYDHHTLKTGERSGIHVKTMMLKDMIQHLGLEGFVFGINTYGKRSIKVNMHVVRLNNYSIGVFGGSKKNFKK